MSTPGGDNADLLPSNDPDETETIPHRRRLPKAFLALFEKTDAARYDALE
jgi:hypothetical protein